METCPCSNSSPVLILGGITDNASEGPTVTQRGALISPAPRWGKCGVIPCFAGCALHLGGQEWNWGLSAEVEAQQEDPHPAYF